MDQVSGVPDFIYERYSLWHPGGIYLARKLGIPFILEVNSPLPLETRKFRRLANEKLADGISRLLMREADGIVCVSDEVADWVISERLHSRGVQVIPNGVDDKKFQPEAKERPPTLPPPGTPLIGFTSTFRPWHGTEDLLEAFRILVEDLNSPAHLVCVGDGPARGEFLKHAEQLELDDRIHAPGRLNHEDVGNWLASCDVAVAPYPELSEFWFSPLKIFEYFGCGLPVVGSDVGQITSLLASGRGHLVPVGDLHAMSSSIHALLNDPEAARKTGDCARRWVLKNATWEIRAREILDLVEAIR